MDQRDQIRDNSVDHHIMTSEREVADYQAVILRWVDGDGKARSVSYWALIGTSRRVGMRKPIVEIDIIQRTITDLTDPEAEVIDDWDNESRGSVNISNSQDEEEDVRPEGDEASHASEGRPREDMDPRGGSRKRQRSENGDESWEKASKRMTKDEVAASKHLPPRRL